MTRTQLAARAACLTHALVATFLWHLRIMLDNDVLPARVWTAVTLLSLPWLLAPALARSGTRLNWLWTIIAGLVILSPTYSTLYSFLAWTIEGFAP